MLDNHNNNGKDIYEFTTATAPNKKQDQGHIGQIREQRI